MRIPRRAIIEENRRLKRDISEIRVKCWETVNNYAKAVETAQKETEKANARLARAGLEGGYEYTGGGVRGTVRVAEYVQVDPVRLTFSGPVPEEIEFARKELAVRIADELIKKGLVFVERGEVDHLRMRQNITVRLDVIPWDALTRRCYIQPDN